METNLPVWKTKIVFAKSKKFGGPKAVVTVKKVKLARKNNAVSKCEISSNT